MRVHRCTNVALVLAIACAAGLAAACGSGEPKTDAERLARGREIIERMSEKLGAAPSLSVTVIEGREELMRDGTPQHASLTREAIVRRPDRLYTTVTGDRHNEVWYDGVGVTVVLHKEKIFGQARAPETLDKTLDAIYERYGLSVPFADYVYSSPAKALLTDSITGGWVARETVDGQEADHLAFKAKGVNWEVWIPASGDPLPMRAVADFADNRRLRKIDMTFKNWNLAPQIAENRFTPTVPPDYEGVAIVQRARVLRDMPKDEGAATTGEAKK